MYLLFRFTHEYNRASVQKSVYGTYPARSECFGLSKCKLKLNKYRIIDEFFRKRVSVDGLRHVSDYLRRVSDGLRHVSERFLLSTYMLS